MRGTEMSCVVMIRCEGRWLGQEVVAAEGWADGLGGAWWPLPGFRAAADDGRSPVLGLKGSLQLAGPSLPLGVLWSSSVACVCVLVSRSVLSSSL